MKSLTTTTSLLFALFFALTLVVTGCNPGTISGPDLGSDTIQATGGDDHNTGNKGGDDHNTGFSGGDDHNTNASSGGDDHNTNATSGGDDHNTGG